MPQEIRREKWESVADWPLTAAAVLFLAAYAWPILEPDLSTPLFALCRLVSLATWIVFAIDYFARLALSYDKRLFFLKNIVDLIVVLLPLLRPLRLLRLITLLQIINRHASGSLRGRVAIYVTGATALVLFVASLAILSVERGHKGANITSFGDAFWWSAETVTTVGYGDRYPVTLTGRLVAIGLMIAGIALLGVVTALVASWFLERVTTEEAEESAATRRDILALTEQVSALRKELSLQENANTES